MRGYYSQLKAARYEREQRPLFHGDSSLPGRISGAEPEPSPSSTRSTSLNRIMPLAETDSPRSSKSSRLPTSPGRRYMSLFRGRLGSSGAVSGRQYPAIDPRSLYIASPAGCTCQGRVTGGERYSHGDMKRIRNPNIYICICITLRAYSLVSCFLWLLPATAFTPTCQIASERHLCCPASTVNGHQGPSRHG
ncbi:hypothetical protein LY76DRAFT_200589 [Colletotrichum caudatum]|nr:hypothetical protein LY76DRAFT_200589 [Colletotrichum caudatum]